MSGNGKDFEPRIVGFLCNWCTYAAADTAEAIYANLNSHYAASLSISINFLIKSTTRWAYPQPLSYQDSVLETFSFWTIVAIESKVLE